MNGPGQPPPATALLILGGEHPRHRTRTRAALAHYAACRAAGQPLPGFIVTGAGRVKHTSGTLSEAQHMAANLRAHGVPASHIWQETQAQNTMDNILLGSALARRHGLQNTQLILVTDDFHLPRSQWLFRQLLGHPPHTCITTGNQGTPWLRWREHWARALQAYKLARRPAR